jgi:hypothetical protein
MFSRFMNQVKLNKTISKQRKWAEVEPNTGYSAVIASLLENEAKGVFNNWPDYMRNTINEYYRYNLAQYKQTEFMQKTLESSNKTDCNEFTLVLTAVMQQAYISKDLPYEEVVAMAQEANPDNMCKVLVNIKLLPARFLNDDIESGVVA